MSVIRLSLVVGSIVIGIRLWNRFCLNRLVYRPRRRLDGRTAIVTGSSSGLGLQLTKELGRRGCRVVMACRDVDKAKAAAQRVNSELSGSARADLSVIECDLSSLRSVEEFVDAFLAREDRLDILVCNGGLGRSPLGHTADGFDAVIQSNYIGHFYLSRLLVDILRATGRSRIINVSSDLHRLVRSIDASKLVEIFRRDNRRSQPNSYSYSKLFQVASTVQLKSVLADEGIDVFAVTPGLVSTSIEDPFEDVCPWPLSSFYRLVNSLVGFLFAKRVEKGVESILFCSIETQLDSSAEIYFKDCRPSQSSLLSRDTNFGQLLFSATEESIGRRLSTV